MIAYLHCQKITYENLRDLRKRLKDGREKKPSSRKIQSDKNKTKTAQSPVGQVRVWSKGADLHQMSKKTA